MRQPLPQVGGARWLADCVRNVVPNSQLSLIKKRNPAKPKKFLQTVASVHSFVIGETITRPAGTAPPLARWMTFLRGTGHPLPVPARNGARDARSAPATSDGRPGATRGGLMALEAEQDQVMSDSQLTTIGRLEDRLDSLKVRL